MDHARRVPRISISRGNHLIRLHLSIITSILDVSEYHQVTESANFRSSVNSHNADVKNLHNTDVKWGNNFSHNKIATAHTNGNIVIWDLGKSGRKTVERIINEEHKRAVTRICFASTHGSLLLSASSDSTMKLWDLRDNKSARNTFEGKSDNVRDVQFNPLYFYEFAAAFENGTIQKWDTRGKPVYERKINAHNGICLTVDWHSDGRILASGGRDKNIQVWDMTMESRKPQYTIRTMAPVAHIQWRPDHENELASCSLGSDNRVHVWDIRRPNIAKYSMEEHTMVPTGFVFLDADTLFSVSKDGYFIRNDIRNAYHLVDLLSKSGIGWNVYGDVAFAAPEALMSPPAQGVVREARAVDMFVDDLAIPGLSSQLPNKRSPQATEAAPQYQPSQTCSIIQFPLFNYRAFTYLARNYVTLGEDVWRACEHNFKVALDIQKYRAAQTWKIIQLLYTHTTEDTSSHSESTTADTSMETISADIISAVDGTAKPDNADAWANSQRSSGYDSGESSDDESEDLGPTNRGRRRHTHRRGLSSTTERGSDAGDSSVQGTQSVASTVIKPQEHAQGSENNNGVGDINEREVTASGRGNRRPVWQHQDVVENLLEYYTEQVSNFILFLIGRARKRDTL
ncbi:LOW QUALITY PROTEIN: hypothetical protein BC937DRAFT_91739 [Endogone sp. FLAS-F59071]|nr:LOW QUALITY PROTEIN: hypothetical protein BC937DRAFT_91739 [Endogone sp. FLAS-F59071]|eukprot:RUS21711.1 LOW QUALITY PROTEIN: hypothetical protein BC937DRAFT_91739 [Endogone sp. FLAS-F59071]